jgi:hypothetical protein
VYSRKNLQTIEETDAILILQKLAISQLDEENFGIACNNSNLRGVVHC